MSETGGISQQWMVVDTLSANSRRGTLTAHQMGDAENDMRSILGWLDPASLPRITVGVDAAPPAVPFE